MFTKNKNFVLTKDAALLATVANISMRVIANIPDSTLTDINEDRVRELITGYMWKIAEEKTREIS